MCQRRVLLARDEGEVRQVQFCKWTAAWSHSAASRSFESSCAQFTHAASKVRAPSCAQFIKLQARAPELEAVFKPDVVTQSSHFEILLGCMNHSFAEVGRANRHVCAGKVTWGGAGGGFCKTLLNTR